MKDKLVPGMIVLKGEEPMLPLLDKRAGRKHYYLKYTGKDARCMLFLQDVEVLSKLGFHAEPHWSIRDKPHIQCVRGFSFVCCTDTEYEVIKVDPIVEKMTVGSDNEVFLDFLKKDDFLGDE